MLIRLLCCLVTEVKLELVDCSTTTVFMSISCVGPTQLMDMKTVDCGMSHQLLRLTL